MIFLWHLKTDTKNILLEPSLSTQLKGENSHEGGLKVLYQHECLVLWFSGLILYPHIAPRQMVNPSRRTKRHSRMIVDFWHAFLWILLSALDFGNVWMESDATWGVGILKRDPPWAVGSPDLDWPARLSDKTLQSFWMASQNTKTLVVNMLLSNIIMGTQIENSYTGQTYNDIILACLCIRDWLNPTCFCASDTIIM